MKAPFFYRLRPVFRHRVRLFHVLNKRAEDMAQGGFQTSNIHKCLVDAGSRKPRSCEARIH